jgi:hypothetical protein
LARQRALSHAQKPKRIMDAKTPENKVSHRNESEDAPSALREAMIGAGVEAVYDYLRGFDLDRDDMLIIGGWSLDAALKAERKLVDKSCI